MLLKITFSRRRFFRKIPLPVRDLKVLPRVVQGNVENSLHNLDQMLSELNKIKKAMIQAKACMDLAA